jgi:hypothetical protein
MKTYCAVTASGSQIKDGTVDPTAGDRLVEVTADDLRRHLWWLAQEMRNTADAIGPAPAEAERALRALADQVEKCDWMVV